MATFSFFCCLVLASAMMVCDSYQPLVVITPFNKVRTRLGSTVAVNCSWSGVSATRQGLRWDRHSEAVEAFNDSLLVGEGNAGRVFSYWVDNRVLQLIVVRVELSDGGTYECWSADRTSQTFEIIIAGKGENNLKINYT